MKEPKTKHTRGNWRTHNNVYIADADGNVIANFPSYSGLPQIEREANCKLAAAAPNLLEMLIDLKQTIENKYGFTLHQMQKVDAAIKKATE